MLKKNIFSEIETNSQIWWKDLRFSELQYHPDLYFLLSMVMLGCLLTTLTYILSLLSQ